jgi:hypothetical protein
MKVCTEVDWYLFQAGDQWRMPLKKIINLTIPDKVGDILTKAET